MFSVYYGYSTPTGYAILVTNVTVEARGLRDE